MKGSPPARSASRSARRLFAAYAVVSLVPVLLLGTVLLALTHRQATARGLAQGRSEATLVSRTVVAPLLEGHPLDQGLHPAETTALRRSVMAAISDGEIVRLRIRDLHGRIVWASDPTGVLGSPDDEALAAAAGSPETHITRLDADRLAPGEQPGPRVAEAYVPIDTGAADRRLGVLEVYLPYAPISHAVAADQRQTMTALIVGLVVLWLALLGVSMSVSLRLRRSATTNEFLAAHDTLTGLPNRAEFSRVAIHALAHATSDRATAVAVIDLDRFKEVNDTLGHGNGDRLLMQLTDRLVSRLRDQDMVARLGGDEFGVVLRGVHGPSEAVEILQRLRSALAEPLSLDGLPLAIEASIGFALAPQDGADVETLMTHADVAMYVAKRQHQGVVHYNPEQDQYNAATLSLVAELGAAIDAGQLVLHYQPKSDLRAGSITAVEALVRWQHPTRGLLYPDAFLLAAEQTELVEPLTRWVLREAVTTLRTLDPSGRLAIAVNVSARSLTRLEFADDVMAILTDTETDPGRVILEVTETALVSDPARAASTLTRLHDYGIRVSVDDFGAGQTSLGYLATLPIAELKIDKAFVLAMTSDDRNAAIVHSVIELGHSLGFTVTAEGVETQQTLDDLTAADCDLVQGYLLARPMTADKLRRHLDSRPAPRPDIAPAPPAASRALPVWEELPIFPREDYPFM